MSEPETDPREGERVLVVDDSPETLELVERHLASAGYRIVTSPGVEEALRILHDTPVDLVITDMKMPRVSGLDLIRHIRENFRDLEVIMITGYATIEGAVAAVKLGAEEYLAKPFTREELLAAVSRAMDALRLRRSALASSLPPSNYGLIGESEGMRRVYAAIEQSRRTGAPVLIFGESGTGRESVARAIHYKDEHGRAPFLQVNCGAIPADRARFELFGKATDTPDAAWPGFLQAARNATVFLADIHELSLRVQEELARAVVTGTDLRLMAATDQELPERVQRNGFSAALYHEISGVRIDLPPLRERGDDILLLTRHFGARAARERERPPARFSDRVLRLLREYHWPGNLRELRNVVEHLVSTSEGGSSRCRTCPG